MTTPHVEEHASAQARFAHARADLKKALVQKCNVARHQLGWDEDTWLAVKHNHGGADSLTQMDIGELEAVLGHARRCGFKDRYKKADGAKSRALSQESQAKKLRAIWLEMHGLGLVRSPDESALCSWVANSRSPNVTTSLDLLGIDQLSDGIERLKQWRARELMKGEAYCPVCQKPFKLSLKQAKAFGRIACDVHQKPIAYLWKKL